MINRLSCMAVFATGLALARAALGASFEYHFDFPQGDVMLRETPDGSTAVGLKDCKIPPTDPGSPLLPVKEFSIRVPEGEEIVNWTVESGEAELLAENVLPVFAPRPHKTGGVDEDKYVPATRNEAVYGLNTPYPAKRADLQHSGKMRGVTIATFRVSPVWFVGAEKKLYLTPSVTVKIFTAAPPKATVANPAGGSVAFSRSQLFEDMINAQVVNPTDSGTRQAKAVSRSGSGCDYLVITTNVQAFVEAAQKLADFRKSFDGVTAEVVDLATISANSSWSAARPDGGTDMQTKIRNCIKWYVQNKGTEYVVLAGDDRVVPIREVYVKTSSSDYYNDAPSDLYYSDLDGTWDEDKNGVYGERSKTDLDLYPDVIVGRLPMRTAAQLTTYVDKVINYEQTTTDDSDIVRKVLWFGYTLWDTLVHFETITVGDTTTNDVWCSVNMDYQLDSTTGEYVKGTTNATVYAAKLKYQLPTERHCDGLMEFLDRPFGTDANDAEFWCRRLHEMHFRSNANWRTSFAFGSATSWDRNTLGDYQMNGDTYWGRTNTVHDILNQGYHFAGLDTHGNYAYVSFEGYETWSSPKGILGPDGYYRGSSSYYSEDAITLTNRVDFFCTEACITGGFDLDGNASRPATRKAYNAESPNFAEGFLRAPKGGSVVFVGCAREGYSYQMQEYSSMASGWQDPNHFSAYYSWTDYGPEYSKDYVNGFWRELIQKRASKVGGAFAASKAEWAPKCTDSYYHWLQLLTNLLGDPLLSVHTPPPRTQETRALTEHSLVMLLRDPSLELTSNSAKIHVAADGIILGETAEVKLEYSTASDFSGAQSVTVASNVKNLGEFSKTLTGLKPSTKYYVRGKMTVTPKSGSPATCTSPFSMSFTTLSGIVPPTGTVASSDVSYTTAKVTATLTDKGGEAANSDVTITLVVSKNSDYSSPVFNQTVTSGTAKSLTGLTADTTYYVKATFAGKTCGSSDATTTFTTSAYSAPTCDQPPAVGSVTADGVTVTVSNVAWGNGSSGGEVKVEILSGSTVVATQTGDKAGAFAFTGLAGNTQYKVRVTLTGSNGLTLVDETQTFTTADPNMPVFTVSVSEVTCSSATVAIAVSTLGQGGATSATPTVRLSKNADLSGAVSIVGSAIPGSSGTVVLTDLDAGTFYYLAVDLKNNLNKTSTSEVVGFQTDFAYHTLPGLRQGIYGCTEKVVPDLTVRTASLEGKMHSNGTSKHAVDRTLGLLMAKSSAQSADANSAPLISDAVSTNSWKWANTTTYLYEGQIYLEAGTTYYFYSKFDDGGAVFIDDRLIFSQENVSGYDSWNSNKACTFGKLGVGVYVCAATGWHEFRGYVWDWTGGKKIMAGMAAVQYTTNSSAIDSSTLGTSLTNAVQSTISSTSLWHEIYDDGTGSFLRILTDPITAVPPTGTVASSDVSYTTAKVTATLADKGDEASNSDVTITLVVSKNSDYSSPVFNQTVTSGTAKSLTGLTANTKYYVKATFAGKTSGSTDATTTFTTSAYSAPTISSVAVSGETTSGAKVSVTIGNWGNGSSGGTVKVEAVINSTVKASANGTASGDYTLSGLDADTTYTARVIATGSNGLATTNTTKTIKTQAKTNPTCDQPPAVGSVTKDGATVTVSNIAWGNGSTGGEVKVELLKGSTVVATQTGDKAGAFAFTGLAGNTQYKVRVTLTGSNGLKLVDETQTFTTEAAPFVTLSAATATVNAEGTSATLAVTVEDTNVSGGALALTLNGVQVKSWTLAKGEFSQAVDVTPGSTNTFSFVASGEDVTETANGSFVAKIYVGWFDVQFGDSGFVAGADWIANSTDKSGGKFTAAEGTETELVKGAVNSVSVDGEVVYTPSHASETGADVKLEGSVQVSIRKTEPTATGAKAAFYFASATKARVYGAGGWTDLAGTFTSGAWLDYVFEFDYSSESAPRVRYTIDSVTSDWIAISTTTRNVWRVRFNDGTFSDFAAGYYSLTGEEPIELVVPEFVTDGSALAFGGAAGSETFSMTIANPVKGAYYTVFTSTTLEGTFTAEKASVLCDSSAATYTLTVDANTPTKFAKIVISTAPFAKDAPLPEK